MSKQEEKFTELYTRLDETLMYSRKGTKFLQLLKSALKEGFPVDYTPKVYGTAKYPTLLHRAITHEREVPMAALLEAGADVNILDNNNRNVLLQLVFNSYCTLSEIKEIVDKTDNLNLRDKFSGLTAFGVLARKFIYTGKAETHTCLHYLLRLGADPYVGADYWKTDWVDEKQEPYAGRKEQLRKILDMYYLQKEQIGQSLTDYEYEL